MNTLESQRAVARQRLHEAGTCRPNRIAAPPHDGFRFRSTHPTKRVTPSPHVTSPPSKGPAQMSEQLQFDRAAMDPRAVYRLLIGSVVPRPIGWASTVSAEGVANLAPFFVFHRGVRRPADDLAHHHAQAGRQREAHARERPHDRRILLQRGDAAGVRKKWSTPPTAFPKTIPNSPRPA